MGQMCITLKAAERAKASEQESWAAKEIEWAKEKANLLEAYKKCRQGLERAVQKLKEEREKQTAMEAKRRAARNKRNLKDRCPTVSDSGGESTWGPTPAGVGEPHPEPTRGPAATGGPSRSGSPPREAAKSERAWGLNQDGGKRDGGGRGRWSTATDGSEPGAAPCGLRAVGCQRECGSTGEVPPPTLGGGGGGRGGPRPNTLG